MRYALNHDRLDVLVNNAGIGAGKQGEMRRETSRDGHELRFAVNYSGTVPAHGVTVAASQRLGSLRGSSTSPLPGRAR